MKRYHLIKSIFFVFLLMFSCDFSYAAPIREVRVGVAVAPSYKTSPEWKYQFERRLAYASKIYETEFGIRFKPAQYWDWNSADARRDMNYLMDDLKNDYPIDRLPGIDLIIGLSHIEVPRTIAEAKDVPVLGRSQPFSGYLLIRSPRQPLFKIQEETIMVHELGHLFGAVHTRDPDSIMSPIVDRQIPTRFDPDNHAIVLLGRELDFKKGIEGMNIRMTQQLVNSYARMVYLDQPFEFYYTLGAFYLRMGRPEDAVKAMKAAIQIDPKSAQAHYDLGSLYVKMGRLDEAIRELSEAEARLNRSGDQASRVQALMMLGAAYHERGSRDAAYRAWSDVLVIDPNNADAKINLAALQLQNGNVDSAGGKLTELLKQNPKDPKILTNLGSTYYQKGQYQLAIDYLKQALGATGRQTVRGEISQVDETQPSEIYQYMGYSYLKLGQKKDALDCFEQACQLNATVECHQQLGELYFQMQDWDRAIGELGMVLNARKNDASLYGVLGTALYQKKEYQKAEAIFRKGIQESSDQKLTAKLHNNLGNMYLSVKQADLALQEFLTSIGKNWNNADSHVGLARVYVAMNRLADARQSLRNALTIDPNRKDASQLLEKIDKISIQGTATVTLTG